MKNVKIKQKNIAFPIFAPPHLLLFLVSIAITYVIHSYLALSENSDIIEVYKRSTIFYLFKIVVFIFGLLIVLNINMYLLFEKFAILRINRKYPSTQTKINLTIGRNLYNKIKELKYPITRTVSYYRTYRTIDFFLTSQNTSDTANYNEKLSELIRENIETNFEYIRYCIWVIPIIGFIGTLWGITSAVSGFSNMLGSIDPTSESKILLDSLRLISLDLSTAFETTLPALVISAVLALFLSHLDRNTDRYLLSLDKNQIDLLISRLEQPIKTSETFSTNLINNLKTVSNELNLNDKQLIQIQTIVSKIRTETEKEYHSTSYLNDIADDITKLVKISQNSLNILNELVEKGIPIKLNIGTNKIELDGEKK